MKSFSAIQVYERQKAIVQMKEDGLSYQEIADLFSISRSLTQKLYEAMRCCYIPKRNNINQRSAVAKKIK